MARKPDARPPLLGSVGLGWLTTLSLENGCFTFIVTTQHEKTADHRGQGAATGDSPPRVVTVQDHTCIGEPEAQPLDRNSHYLWGAGNKHNSTCNRKRKKRRGRRTEEEKHEEEEEE